MITCLGHCWLCVAHFERYSESKVMQSARFSFNGPKFLHSKADETTNLIAKVNVTSPKQYYGYVLLSSLLC